MQSTYKSAFPVFLLWGLLVAANPSLAQCTVQATVQHASCSGKPDGAISLQVKGTPPYKFEWSSGETTQNITEVNAGNYSVKVTDAKGSVATARALVQAKATLKVETQETNTSGNGAADGSLVVQVTGGKAPFRYGLTNVTDINKTTSVEQTHGRFEKLPTGRYMLIVVDASDCPTIKGVRIK
jgi:hypothetical protein